MNEQDFGAKIKARREELGINQKEMAEALGLDQGKISLIEKGLRRIDVVKELPIIARVLKVPIGWFYDSASDKVPIQELVRQYFPNIEFTELQMKRIGKFIEPIVQSYVENDPELTKKINSKAK